MKVFVVITMWKGLIDEVEVFKTEPTNLKPVDEHADNGQLCYELQIKEKEERKRQKARL
tara:strand:- start:472 stop:648 length:177 start_codon:yes stop_codon:yes gene_type:complete